ncbi:MAG: hypothetical protein AB7F65_00395 [Dehalococcoidia bacterium]
MDAFSLVALLLSLLAPGRGDVTFLDRPAVPVRVGAVYHEARGATWCDPDGTYRVVVATRRDGWEETLAHELIHAYDCRDNGAVDGSPGHPRPAERPPGLSDREWSAGDDAHWYVAQVFRTGQLTDAP